MVQAPLKRGQRRQPARSVQMYQSTVEKLDKLVEQGDTYRAEYMRWLVDCAEAGLVGPVPEVDAQRRDGHDLIVGLLDGKLTLSEGLASLERLIFHACQEADDA